mgnify:CR=1 FL=1
MRRILKKKATLSLPCDGIFFLLRSWDRGQISQKNHLYAHHVSGHQLPIAGVGHSKISRRKSLIRSLAMVYFTYSDVGTINDLSREIVKNSVVTMGHLTYSNGGTEFIRDWIFRRIRYA